MKNKRGYFTDWGYTDTVKVLLIGEKKNVSLFYKEIKKLYPNEDIEITKPTSIEAFFYETQLANIKKLSSVFDLKMAYDNGGLLEKNDADDNAKKQFIARTILDQLGGQSKLVAFTGAYNFFLIKNGIAFKIKNRKVNYIQITLNGKDLYDINFLRVSFTKNTSKTISSFEDVYFDSLIPIFEKETGMYLSFYKTGGGIKKMAKGGKPSLLKKGDRVEGYFHYDHTYGQYNIIPYNAYADNSEGVVIDVFKGGIGWRYEIEFKNGETLRLGETMLGEYYDKLRFAKGGRISGIKNGDVFNIILDTNYGIKTEPYRVIVKVVDDKVNSRGQVTILHIEGKMKGTKTDIQVSKLKNQYAEGGMPQGLSIADANPYIAGAKAIKGIAPTSFSALDERLAKKINPDPYRPVFF